MGEKIFNQVFKDSRTTKALYKLTTFNGYMDGKMRIAGISLILFGLTLIGWFVFVELYYLGELESGYEEQKIKSEATIINKIKATKEKFSKMKVNLKNSNASNKKIAQVDTQLNDLMRGLKDNYQKQEKARNDLFESSINTVRNENFTTELGIVGILMIVIGGMIIGASFMDAKDIVAVKELSAKKEAEKETSLEEYLNSQKMLQAKLLKANLSEANLSEADLSGTNLSGVNLSNVNLSGANLSGTNLSKADLTGSNLTKADLTGAKLVNANLTSADLTEANLNKANLTGVNLSGTNLSKANLTGVNLRSSYLEENLIA